MRMAARVVLGAGLLALAALAVRADDFWKRKPPAKWTAEEALRILQNSPWARQQPVASMPARKGADLSIPRGTVNCSPDAIDINGNCLERRLQLPRDESRSPGVYISNFYYAIYLVRWESAAPVEAAFRRLEELGQRAGVTYQAPPSRRPADRYVITLSVLRPGRDAGDPFAEREDSKEKKRVRLKTSRGTFVPLETERSGVGASAAVHFFFPRQQDGKPVLDPTRDTAEFVFEGARGTVKCKFSVDAEWFR